MRAPGFWYRPAGPAARVLQPLGALYGLATRARLARGGRARVGVPVLCVGNLNAGGTGKTPTVIWLLAHLAARGVAAHVVSRGYGGSNRAVLRIDEAQHNAALTGDEPLLLAAFGPVWISPDRVSAARAAAAAGAQAVILDDGFQDPSLAHDLSLVVADAARGFGNGLCLPAGPLREGVRAGLSRADLVVTLGEAPAQAQFDRDWGHATAALPHLRGSVRVLQMGMDWRGHRVLAFAGIAYPEKFFATLRGLGVDLVHAEPLADHQPITPALFQRLEADAARLGAQLVTTEKDAVRLPRSLRSRVLALPVRLEVDDPLPLDAALARIGL